MSEVIKPLKKPFGWVVPFVYTDFDIKINDDTTIVRDYDVDSGHCIGHCVVYRTKKEANEAGDEAIPIYATRHIKENGYIWYSYSFVKPEGE